MPNAEKAQLNGLGEYLSFMAVAALLAVIIVTIVILADGLRGVLRVS
jgi:hypothetical protein